ncbi:MAG: radical SAM protein [Desulfohalobiaceae bacterium]|nr:radical SAM protein [Desulfohalobiaceae bacterium]
MMPENLCKINKIIVDPGVKDSPLAKRVKSRLPELEWEMVEEGGQVSMDHDRTVLYLKEYKGRFLRFCPGTKHYRCCGYRIIHIGENCPLNCSYCILKAYFKDRTLKVWANQEDLYRELEANFLGNPGRRFRVGTGEFADSLALESITGYSRDLVSFLKEYDNVCLELKSKIVDLSWMKRAGRSDRILPAWSLNAFDVVKTEERGVASLEERLMAARTCAGNGFRVCLHFDPIICYPEWEKGYAKTIEMIFDYVRPEEIAYFSLGSFRGMPELKAFIEKNWPDSDYIYNEFITGLDGKMRLLRPLRVNQFRFIADRLKRGGLERQLYFCMESDEVWQAVLGYTPRDLGGLQNHLLEQAFGEKA